MSLDRYFFTIQDPRMSADANVSGTRTWYCLANGNTNSKHNHRNILGLWSLAKSTSSVFWKRKERHAFAGMALSIVCSELVLLRSKNVSDAKIEINPGKQGV